jgi:polyisoprenoid-binding protein YceI
MTKDTKWSIDQAHSEINFKVKHLMISNVTGTFKTFDASIYTTGKDFKTAAIDLWIDASSITTGDLKRDEHIKNGDFFDVQNYKEITFTANTISEAGPDGNHELWGELTMKGITKPVKLNVHFGGIQKDPFGNEKAGFTVTGKINRSEWGLIWNTPLESGGVMLSEEIKILCEVELSKVNQSDLTMELAAAAKATNN